MDQIPTQQTHNEAKPNTKTKTNPSIGCFKFSRKARNKNFPEKIRSDDHNHKKFLCFITLSRGCLKKSSSTRTVPVDAHTVSEILKPDKKLNQIAKAKSKSDQIEFVLPVVPDPNLQAKPQETSYGPTQETNLENRKQLDHSRTPKANSQKIQSFNRKIDAIRNGSNQPGSPKDVTAKQKPSKIPSMVRQFSKIALLAEVKNKQVGLKSESRLDPIVGLSIIMVTLIIMLLWGRLCAILCTSAWFYFVPMLTNAIGSDIESDSDSKTLDVNSEEYKRKVVLEGFLRRN